MNGLAWARGLVGGTAVYLAMDSFKIVNRPLALAIFAGALIAYFGLKEEEKQSE